MSDADAHEDPVREKLTQKEGLAELANPAQSSLQRRVSFPVAVSAILLALVIGAGLGMLGTVRVLCTWEHPMLDKKLQKLIYDLGYRVNISILDDEDDDVIVTSCTEGQPLLERRENVLDADTFKKVQECLTDHPMITKNHLNPDGFNGTRGFVINFSGEGVDTFTAETKFNCGEFNPLLPFFKAARHPETNGFVMNVLVCDKPTDAKTLSVGVHVDDTLAHNKVCLAYPCTLGLRVSRKIWQFLTSRFVFDTPLVDWPQFSCTHCLRHVRLCSRRYEGRGARASW